MSANDNRHVIEVADPAALAATAAEHVLARTAANLGVTAFLEKRAPRFTGRPSKDMPPFYPWWT